MTGRPASVDLVTAHHEAGHALAAWQDRVSIRRITIDQSGDAAGRMHHAPIFTRGLNPDWGTGWRVRDRGERLIRICLAGPIAQRKFNPRSWRQYHGAGDFGHAVDMILRFAAPGEHADTYMRLLQIEARQTVEKWWRTIEALAAALVTRRKMTGAEVHRFIRAVAAEELKASLAEREGNR